MKFRKKFKKLREHRLVPFRTTFVAKKTSFLRMTAAVQTTVGLKAVEAELAGTPCLAGFIGR
jgi:hypothetical protein